MDRKEGEGNTKFLDCCQNKREITADAEVAVDSLDDLKKKIFNILLDPAIALTAGVVTNQDGYNWLDSLKDKDGKYILQPDQQSQQARCYLANIN